MSQAVRRRIHLAAFNATFPIITSSDFEGLESHFKARELKPSNKKLSVLRKIQKMREDKQ